MKSKGRKRRKGQERGRKESQGIKKRKMKTNKEEASSKSKAGWEKRNDRTFEIWHLKDIMFTHLCQGRLSMAARHMAS